MEKKPYSYQFYHTTSSAWDAMYQALCAAQKSIYWEVYIFVDDEVGKRFIDILSQKAKAGVEVKLIIDAMGSFMLSRQAERELMEAGVEVLKFNRLYPEWKLAKWLSRLMFRNHRKVLIIDEKNVFLGGVNIEAVSKTWDDVYVKIVGQTPWPLLRGFAKSYISAGGDRASVRHFLHPKLKLIEDWRNRLKFIVHSPRYATMKPVWKLYIRALATAQETVNLITPYYVPDKDFLKAVAKARKRGVKINLFLPLRTDHKYTELIARAYYGLTTDAGADIYFLPNMNHGKAVTADDKMGVVGSLNISRRGTVFNDESAVHFTDEDMVRDLNAMFATLKEGAQPFNQAEWKKRGWLDRLQEWIARKIEHLV